MRKSVANMATQRQVATIVSSVTTISNYGNRMVTLQVLPSSRVNALTVSRNLSSSNFPVILFARA